MVGGRSDKTKVHVKCDHNHGESGRVDGGGRIKRHRELKNLQGSWGRGAGSKLSHKSLRSSKYGSKSLSSFIQRGGGTKDS